VSATYRAFVSDREQPENTDPTDVQFQPQPATKRRRTGKNVMEADVEFLFDTQLALGWTSCPVPHSKSDRIRSRRQPSPSEDLRNLEGRLLSEPGPSRWTSMNVTIFDERICSTISVTPSPSNTYISSGCIYPWKGIPKLAACNHLGVLSVSDGDG